MTRVTSVRGQKPAINLGREGGGEKGGVELAAALPSMVWLKKQSHR